MNSTLAVLKIGQKIIYRVSEYGEQNDANTHIDINDNLDKALNTVFEDSRLKNNESISEVGVITINLRNQELESLLNIISVNDGFKKIKEFETYQELLRGCSKFRDADIFDSLTDTVQIYNKENNGYLVIDKSKIDDSFFKEICEECGIPVDAITTARKNELVNRWKTNLIDNNGNLSDTYTDNGLQIDVLCNNRDYVNWAFGTLIESYRNFPISGRVIFLGEFLRNEFLHEQISNNNIDYTDYYYNDKDAYDLILKEAEINCEKSASNDVENLKQSEGILTEDKIIDFFKNNNVRFFLSDHQKMINVFGLPILNQSKVLKIVNNYVVSNNLRDFPLDDSDIKKIRDSVKDSLNVDGSTVEGIIEKQLSAITKFVDNYKDGRPVDIQDLPPEMSKGDGEKLIRLPEPEIRRTVNDYVLNNNIKVFPLENKDIEKIHDSIRDSLSVSGSIVKSIVEAQLSEIRKFVDSYKDGRPIDINDLPSEMSKKDGEKLIKSPISQKPPIFQKSPPKPLPWKKISLSILAAIILSFIIWLIVCPPPVSVCGSYEIEQYVEYDYSRNTDKVIDAIVTICDVSTGAACAKKIGEKISKDLNDWSISAKVVELSGSTNNIRNINEFIESVRADRQLQQIREITIDFSHEGERLDTLIRLNK